MEVDPTGDLLEADIYTVVQVLYAVVIKTHANVQNYQDCDCDLNVGQMGYEDLMVALAPDISSAVVVLVNIRATEVLKNNYFMH